MKALSSHIDGKTENKKTEMKNEKDWEMMNYK